MYNCPWQHLTTLSDWCPALNLRGCLPVSSTYHYFITSFLHAGDVRFSLNGTTYQNNSLVTLEDIGAGDNALLCITNLSACCRPVTGENGGGSWFFPNGTRVPGSSEQFHRTRAKMMVLLNHRRGGEDGIYHCVIPDSLNALQTIYIGVYTSDSGEWHC